MSIIGLVVLGIQFASWLELLVALLLLFPLIFFAVCIVYLLSLLINALPLRARIVALPIPGSAPQNPPALSIQNSSAQNSSSARFTLLIPAHNEELLLGAALEKLRHIDYPQDRYRIVVIADNCSDTTAQIAREAGVLSLERFDKQRIGKGYALEDTMAWLMSAESSNLHGISQQSPAQDEEILIAPYVNGSTTLRPALKQEHLEGWEDARAFDAIIILDADTFVSTNLLSVFADKLSRGETAIQARYDVLNTGESWRTRLMSCALALAHVVKPLGRERLGLSDGLKGNGMCFARTVVEDIPWSGESVTEDIEYALRLCRAKHRIAFVSEACVWAQMPTTGRQAATQRQRWEGGRYRLLFQVAPQLLLEGIQTGNRLVLDRAIELIIPPFAEMFALPVVFGALSAIIGIALGWHLLSVMAFGWFAILLLQAAYLFAGMWVARMPLNVIVSLLFAPFYILWKLGIYLVMAAGRSTGGWKRTERHQMSK